jgi:hypothetical protein
MASIIKNALASMESMDVKLEVTPTQNAKDVTAAPVVTIVTNTVASTPEKPVSSNEQTQIALDGPLSTIYFKALNIAYAKPDPVTGVVSTESLALADYYRAAEIQKKLSDESIPSKEEETVNPNPNNTALVAPMSKDEVIPIVKELINVGSGGPADYCIVFDTMSPTPYSPMGTSNDIQVVNMDKTELIALEDIEGVTIFVKMKKK